jgi:4-amino-4-deoxy-L-arabinose transferase-like glycosyltransferase
MNLSSLRHRFFSFLQHSRFLDWLWLFMLAAFILAGMMLATFHGDEAMQIYMSRDYVTAFIDREPAQLMVAPPYNIDEDPWLRILNGSVNRYAIGLSWHLAGLNSDWLPPRPGWDWGLDYDTNVQTGHRPSESLMLAGRISSTLFLVLSAWIMFGMGWQIAGRLTGYISSALYTLNPIVLLNGRRAMMEGSLLCFGLLTVLIAVMIVRKRAKGLRESLLWWLALILAGGLTLASKHSGILFVGGAFGWIITAELIRVFDQRATLGNDLRRVFRLIVQLIVGGMLVIALFIALSPALWNDPLARLGDLIDQRQRLIDIQVAADPAAPTPLSQRMTAIIQQPFIAPVAHFEVSFWANAAPIQAEVEHYMTSPFSGLHLGESGGILPTILAGAGLLIVLRHWRTWQFGIWFWIAFTIISLLANPLPWQRYYLPWIPPITLLAATGIVTIVKHITRFSP